jgi:hypothetical protein
MAIIWLILFLSILLFEVIFKWRLFIVELNDSFLTTIFFSLAYSLMLFFFLVFFQPKTMKRLMIVIMTILTILYLNQDIYHTIVENFYSVQIAGDFSLGLSYMDNTFPYTLPKMFGQEGYSSYSYHNYIDYFYPRRAFHTQTLGYDIYKNASDFGLLEDTVIMIYGDHYAYGIEENTIWDYDTHKEDQNSNDLHNVPMILYDYDQVMADTFTEYMSSIDILPTIANLFGLNMNYRYVFGRDVFSEQNHIVVFPDLSFVSKDFEYDALTESYRILNETYTSDELSALSSIFITKYRYNILILDNDYFKEDD